MQTGRRIPKAPDHRALINGTGWEITAADADMGIDDVGQNAEADRTAAVAFIGQVALGLHGVDRATGLQRVHKEDIVK